MDVINHMDNKYNNRIEYMNDQCSFIQREYLSTVGSLRHAIYYCDSMDKDMRIAELLRVLEGYAVHLTDSHVFRDTALETVEEPV